MPHEYAYDEDIKKYLIDNESGTFTNIYEFLRSRYPRITPLTVKRHLDKMVHQNILIKDSKPRYRNKKPYYLSDNAKKQLRIFGQIEPIRSERKRRISGSEEMVQYNGGTKSYRKVHRLQNLYRLVFFCSVVNPPIRNISEEQLDNALATIKRSRGDLEVDQVLGSEHSKQIVYKPLEYVRIIKNEFSSMDPNQGVTISYDCRRLSLSFHEIKRILNRDNDSKIRLFGIPFVNDDAVTDEDFKDMLDLLKDRAWLIGTTQNDMFSLNDEVRYFINDNTLQGLIAKIWNIHANEFNLLRAKMDYLGPPNKEEENWLNLIYGEDSTKIITKRARITKDKRRSRRRMRYDKKGDFTALQKYFRSWGDEIDKLIVNLNRAYNKQIEEYDFPANLLEDICFRKIFVT